MKTENTLKFAVVVLDSYGILIMVILLFNKVLQQLLITPLEISVLISVVMALLLRMWIDVMYD